MGVERHELAGLRTEEINFKETYLGSLYIFPRRLGITLGELPTEDSKK